MKDIKSIKESMVQYTGTKTIMATPMSRGEYNALRGWEVPADEDPMDLGYLVMYQSEGKPNVEGFKGYVSWSPKATFDSAYKLDNTHKDSLRNEMELVSEKIHRLEDGLRFTNDRVGELFFLKKTQLHTLKAYYSSLSSIWTHLYGWETNPSRYEAT